MITVDVDDGQDMKEGSRDEWLTDEDDKDSDGSGEWIDVSHSEDYDDNVDDDKEDSEKEHGKSRQYFLQCNLI